MKNEIAQQNNGYIQNYQENYTVHEIAQKIIDNPKYREYLETAIPQIAKSKEYSQFRLYVYEKARVFKGAKLGAFGEAYTYTWYERGKNFEATADGLFIPDLGKFRKWTDIDKFAFISEQTYEIEIGKIYPLEFPFYFRNKAEIEREIERIKKQQAESVKNQQKKAELEKQQKKEEEQRNAEKLLKEQQESIEDIAELLKELDKYVLAKQTIAIETLQEIENDLKILFSQKDNLKDIKSIKNYAKYFETTYKEAKKNPNLTDIIENRMLTILRMLFELLGKSKESISDKFEEIRQIANSENLTSKIRELEIISENNEKIKIEFLQSIEDLLNELIQQGKILNASEIEDNKSIFDAIFEDCKKRDDLSNSSKLRMQRIANKLSELFQTEFSKAKNETTITDFIPQDSTTQSESTPFTTPPEYAIECKSSDVIAKIKAMTKSGTIVVFGKISNETITAIKNSINEKKFGIQLDLSNTIGLTEIGDFAFSDCANLESIILPNNITHIGEFAFECCLNLTSITIPNDVSYIGKFAFSNCSNIQNITIPNSLTSIEDFTFECCSSLTSITIPNKVTSIGDNSFYNCANLESVTIPNSVTSIGDAFKLCPKLTLQYT